MSKEREKKNLYFLYFNNEYLKAISYDTSINVGDIIKTDNAEFTVVGKNGDKLLIKEYIFIHHIKNKDMLGIKSTDWEFKEGN